MAVCVCVVDITSSYEIHIYNIEYGVSIIDGYYIIMWSYNLFTYQRDK